MAARKIKPFAIGTHVLITEGARIGMAGIVTDPCGSSTSTEIDIDGIIHRVPDAYLEVKVSTS